MDLRAIINSVGENLKRWDRVLDLLEQFYQEYSRGDLTVGGSGIFEQLMDAYADWKRGKR